MQIKEHAREACLCGHTAAESGSFPALRARGRHRVTPRSRSRTGEHLDARTRADPACSYAVTRALFALALPGVSKGRFSRCVSGIAVGSCAMHVVWRLTKVRKQVSFASSTGE